jgi:phosphatidylglycerol:prolipoprotein diacylglycerol transferase
MDFGQAENPAWAKLGVRHELGLYETYLAMVMSLLWLWLDRKPRKAGFYAATWCLLYAPCRFGLDFLRSTDLAYSDVRWAGLTPAQWGCFVLVACGLSLVAWLRKQPAP